MRHTIVLRTASHGKPISINAEDIRSYEKAAPGSLIMFRGDGWTLQVKEEPDEIDEVLTESYKQ